MRRAGVLLLCALVAASAPTAWGQLDAVQVGSQLLSQGRIDEAIEYFESQLDRPEDHTLATLHGLFGHLGLAYYQRGRAQNRERAFEAALSSYRQSAVYFTAAKESADRPLAATVAEYYRAVANLSAGNHHEARLAAEAFLNGHPEAAVIGELLPEEVLGHAHEILAVSLTGLAEEAQLEQPVQAERLQDEALEYAVQAIAGWPDDVIQPYLIRGLEAYADGDVHQAESDLRVYVARMEQIDTREWDVRDEADYANALQLLVALTDG